MSSRVSRIAEYDRRIEQIAKEVHPEVASLRQVKRVGPPNCIDLHSDLGRSVPISPQPRCGMFCAVASRAQKTLGRASPRCTSVRKEDRYLRILLVQAEHYIQGPFGEDSDLRRWGLKLTGRGGKNAEKRAVVAVVQKLAVLLRRPWVRVEVYEPLRNNHKVESAAA